MVLFSAHGTLDRFLVPGSRPVAAGHRSSPDDDAASQPSAAASQPDASPPAEAASPAAAAAQMGGHDEGGPLDRQRQAAAAAGGVHGRAPTLLDQLDSRSIGLQHVPPWRRPRHDLHDRAWSAYRMCGAGVVQPFQPESPVTGVALHPQGAYVCTAQADGALHIYEVAALQHAAASWSCSSRGQELSGGVELDLRPYIPGQQHGGGGGRGGLATARCLLAHRADDLSWDHRHPGRLAVVGASGRGVTVLDIAQGARRSALLTLGSQGPGGAAAASSAGLSSVHYCPAGSPYTLVASGRAGGSGGGCVHLWDARRGTAAVAHLVTPGRSALQSGVELSPDGVLVMAVSQPNQLVLWDVRKGSTGTPGVLNLGAAGPYHHAVLQSTDLDTPLAAAIAGALDRFDVCGAASGMAAGGVDGAGGRLAGGAMHPGAAGASKAASATGLGMGGPMLQAVRRDQPRPPPVDWLGLDPQDPGRLGLVLQNCTSVVVDLAAACGGGGAVVTHACLPDSVLFRAALQGQGLGQGSQVAVGGVHLQYAGHVKRGAWGPAGELAAPGVRIGTAVQEVGPTAMAAGSTAAFTLGAKPTLALVDCRLRSKFDQRTPAAWLAREVRAAGTCFGAGAGSGGGVAGGYAASDVAVAADGEPGLDVDSSGGGYAEAIAGMAFVRAALQRPHSVPVRSWITSVACHGPSGDVLAGTVDGQLMVITNRA